MCLRVEVGWEAASDVEAGSDGVAFFDDEVFDEGLSDAFAELLAAVVDLVFEFSAESFDVGGGGWGEVGFFDGFDEFGVSGL